MRVLTLVAVVLGVASIAHAGGHIYENLAYWNFDTPARWYQPDATLQSLTVSEFTYNANGGSGTAGATYQGPVFGEYWRQASGFPTDLSYGAFFEFSIALPRGYSMNVGELEFQDFGAGQGPTHHEVRYSIDGSNFTTWGEGTVGHGADITKNGPTNVRGTIYFRFYANSAGSDSGTWQVDEVNLWGNVNAPEPGTMALVAFGAAVVLGRLRRK